MQNIPLFGDSASKITPPAVTVTSGYFPLQYLPAENLNYYLNGATQAIQEWVNLITLAGLTPGTSQQGWAAISGLLAARNLSFFAPTTSAQLASVLSDETGSGFAVFSNSPTLSGLVTIPDAASDQLALPFGQSKLQPDFLYNAGLSASVGANALTIALKQRDGSTDPAAGVGQIALSFRSSTLATGSFNRRSVTGALSLTIPSGATMGFANGVVDTLYVYAIDVGGTVELAVSTEDLWGEGALWDTTALSAGSSSRAVLYSTTARSGVPIRFVGKLIATEATAGTWATAPSQVSNILTIRSGIISGTATGVSLSTGADKTVTSIVIPPGTWDISGGLAFTPTATTVITGLQFGTNTTTDTLSGVSTNGLPDVWSMQSNQRIPILATTVTQGTTAPIGMPLQTFRVFLTVQTTLFLVASAAFSASTLTGRGWLQARRVR